MTDAEYLAWLARDNSQRCVLVELDYQYESGGAPATGTLYLSDRVYFDGTGAHPYVDGIATVPEFSRSLGGDQLGTYSSSLGSLELDNADGRLDSLLTLAIDGSEIRFYLGDVTWPRTDFRIIFSAMSAKAVAPAFDRISVQLKDTGLLLDKSIGGETRVGGTGPNADRWRPVNFGLVHQVECLVMDPVTLTYVHSDTGVGLVPASTIIRDRGLAVVFTENADGTFKLAASPDGTITADVLYCATSIGHDRRCVSDAMLTLIGQRSGLITAGLWYGAGPTYEVRSPLSVGAWLLAGGEDYQIGISLPDKRNVLDLLGDITNSGLCFWAIRRDGKFTFGRLRPNNISVLGVASTKVFTEDLIDQGSLQLEHLTPTYYQLQATMSKNWSIQNNLAASLSPEEYAKFTRSGLYAIQGNGVGTAYADAPQLYNKTLVQSPMIETLLSGSDDANDKAYLQLWMEVRRAMSLPWITILTMVVGIDAYDVELGDPVTVRIPRFGYDAGVDFQVIGINIKLPAKVELKMIRRDVQASYLGRTIHPAGGAPYSGDAKIFTATASFIPGEAYALPLGTAPARTMGVTASIIPGAASGSTGGPGFGDPFIQAAYVTIGNDSRLTDERALVAGTGITITDNGPNANVVVAATGGGSSSPLTTKGDVWGFDTDDDRIPVGANDYVLTADSAEALGVKWAPVPGAGTLQGEEFITPGSHTYNVPSGITSVWATFVGAGGAGGGSTADATGGGGGGSGEQVVSMPMIVTSGGTLAIVIGAAGAGASGAAGGAGGTTTVGGFNALGGLGGLLNSFGGAGGGPRGGAGGTGSNPGITGQPEAVTYFAGSGGGGPGLTGVAGAAGGPSGGTSGGAGGALVSSKSGGGGGASSPYGVGGAGGAGGSNGTNATSGRYGVGGGGAGGKTAVSTGGNGMDGYCLIQWIA